MTKTLTRVEIPPVVLRLAPVIDMSDEQFFDLCQLNRDLRLERTSQGDLVIMPPTGGETGRTNFKLTQVFGNWMDADGTGVGFDSSTGFTLPNGATRSPDLAWVKRSRWEALTPQQREQFPPLCPDFVLELRSPSDALATVQAKMQEYLDNGAHLGWLIDPIEKKVYIYRPQAPVECLDNPQTVSGDPVLPGFVLELERVWNGSALRP
jgi:Uma2 family endonuclease